MGQPFQVANDGLYIESVGKWAKEKYKHIRYYADLFSTGMKNKWDCLTYIDLFAGAGIAKIKDTEEFLPASPLQALNVTTQFGKYIFCEIDSNKIHCLKSRVDKLFPTVEAHYVDGDVNENIDRVCNLIPKARKSFSVLSFCVADPYNIESLKFSTIEKLAKSYVDFFILIPSGMDANRNESIYIDDSHTHIECYLGDSCWRAAWDREKIRNKSFGEFLVDSYVSRMQSLGYKSPPHHQFVCVRNPINRSPLYHLTFFSRNEQGIKFWKEARKYTTAQLKLPFE
jgi:three-Cys-motif partner protein